MRLHYNTIAESFKKARSSARKKGSLAFRNYTVSILYEVFKHTKFPQQDTNLKLLHLSSSYFWEKTKQNKKPGLQQKTTNSIASKITKKLLIAHFKCMPVLLTSVTAGLLTS